MKSRRSQLRSYALYLKHVCPQLSSVETLVHGLQHPASVFSYHGITFPITCTSGFGRDEGSQQVCQIFEELPLWNELLWFIKVELKEIDPGLISIVRLPHAIVSPDNFLEAERAAIFLHWLLAQHLCITSVEVDCCLLQNHHQLFCDALQLSTSLRVLRLSKLELDVRPTAHLVSAICGTCHLEELECDQLNLSGVEESLLASFSDFIRNSASLKMLKLTRIHKMRHVEVFMQALQGNSSISKLIVEAPLTPDSIADFCKFLASSTTLIELCLDCYTDELMDYVKPLCTALVANEKLQKITIRNHRFDLVDATLLCDMIAVNTTLKDLAFCNCEWEFLTPGIKPSGSRTAEVESAKARWGELWRVEPLVHAIRNNTSLQELVLDTNRFVGKEFERLLVAVKESASLQKLWFHHFPIRPTVGTCDLLEKTNAFDKIASMYCCCSSVNLSESLPRYRSLLSVTEYTFYDLIPERLGLACTALEAFDYVCRLDLHIKQTEAVINEESAALLASYLSSTTSLRQLRMHFSVSFKGTVIIVAGLVKNASLERLHVYGWTFTDTDVHAICDWIEQSRSLYYFVWLSTCCNAAALMVSELAGRLDKNYTLTQFRVSGCRQDVLEWQALQQLVRRNASLVHRAARFVLGSTLKRCASAFEAVSWHPDVRGRVQEMAVLSATEVSCRIEKSARRLEKDFWQLSEIVKGQIRCNAREDGVVQLDELGFDALLAVRRFLKVGDIADSLPLGRRGLKRKASEEND
uniref:Nlr family card domain protein n=1 Tax=Amblyomma triste TaxID=251400 RepID=A0A023G977_AMBTT